MQPSDDNRSNVVQGAPQHLLVCHALDISSYPANGPATSLRHFTGIGLHAVREAIEVVPTQPSVRLEMLHKGGGRECHRGMELRGSDVVVVVTGTRLFVVPNVRTRSVRVAS